MGITKPGRSADPKPRHRDCHNPGCPLANPPGHSLTAKGYWRIHTRGPDKNKYLHRWVVEKLAGQVPGPEVEIHHLDWDAQNCCPYNLAVLPKDVHQGFDNSSRAGVRKGRQGFAARPGANAEIDKLVVEMIAEDFGWPPIKGEQIGLDLDQPQQD